MNYTDTTIAQAWVGRSCGWHKNRDIKIYAPEDSIRRYVDLIDMNFKHGWVDRYEGSKYKKRGNKIIRRRLTFASNMTSNIGPDGGRKHNSGPPGIRFDGFTRDQVTQLLQEQGLLATPDALVVESSSRTADSIKTRPVYGTRKYIYAPYIDDGEKL